MCTGVFDENLNLCIIMSTFFDQLTCRVMRVVLFLSSIFVDCKGDIEGSGGERGLVYR